MGSEVVHYVVLGVSINDKAEVKKFFGLTEGQYELMDAYHDNTYQEGITPTASGIHIISDGMNGDYVVVGKILQKAIYNGLKLMEIPTSHQDGTDEFIQQYRDIYPEIEKLDQGLGTKFGGMYAKVIVFSHWH